MNRPRLPDWSQRLDAVMAAGRRAAFAWGEHDCMAFPAKGVFAVTGRDVFAPFRGLYSDEEGARALMPRPDVYLAELAEREGWEPARPFQARRGDVGLIHIGPTWVCGLCYDGWHVARDRGNTRFPLRAAGLVWNVGTV